VARRLAQVLYGRRGRWPPGDGLPAVGGSGHPRRSAL